MSTFPEGTRFRRGTEVESQIDNVLHGDGWFMEVRKDEAGSVVEAHYLIPVREPDDDLARARKSKCYVADTCILDYECPFESRCRESEDDEE